MEPPSRDAQFTACVSGFLAGVAMLVAMAATAVLVLGQSLLYPARVMGAVVTGDTMLGELPVTAIVAGAFAHFTGPTIFWARVYGLLRGWGRGPPRLVVSVLTGLGVAVVAELLDVRLLLPAAQRALRGGRNLWVELVPPALDWAGHLTFGLTLGVLFYVLRTREKL